MPIPQKLWNQPLETISTKETANTAAKRMLDKGIGALIVMDGDKFVGIISERDLMTKMVACDRESDVTFVHELMTTELITIPETESIDSALCIMADQHIRHLPLTDITGNPIAMLSFRELFSHRIKEQEQENETLAALILTDSPGG